MEPADRRTEKKSRRNPRSLMRRRRKKHRTIRLKQRRELLRAETDSRQLPTMDHLQAMIPATDPEMMEKEIPATRIQMVRQRFRSSRCFHRKKQKKDL